MKWSIFIGIYYVLNVAFCVSSEQLTGLRVNSLRVKGDNTQDASVCFRESESSSCDWEMSLLHGLQEDFVIQNKSNDILHLNSSSIDFKAKSSSFLSVSYEQDMYISEVKQWSLIISESFWNEPVGWSMNSISKCGGIFMLGGYGILAKESLRKTFENIPTPHQTVRVQGSFHFIDAWTGETAFIKRILPDDTEEFLWTCTYDLSKTKQGIDVCGSAYPEGQLSNQFDFTFPHNKDSFTLVFSTTLENDPYENSYGISNLSIYIR